MMIRQGMKRGIRLLSAAAMVVSSGMTSAAETVVKVPVGTAVMLELQQTISSKTAGQGEKVRLEVMSDVKVKGHVVIKKGSPAIGEVSSTSEAGMVGTAGHLYITLQTVEAVDGGPILISTTKGNRGEDKVVKSAVIAGMCCVFALFMKGKDVVMEKGTVFTAITLAPAEVTVN